MTDIARERKFLRDQGLDFITREDWNAVQSYTSARDVFEPVEGFVLHISVTIDGGNTGLTEEDDMRDIERIGQERFSIGFPYNAAIFDTGRLYEGQPLTRRGAHTVDDKNIGYKSTGSGRSMNFWWRAIVLPQMVTDDVTEAQVRQCARWAAAQIRAGYAKRDAIWIGHRDVAWKSCPGNTGYARLPDIRRLTEYYVVNGLDTQDGEFHIVDERDKAIMRNIIRQELYGDEDAHTKGMKPIIRDEVTAVIERELQEDGSITRKMHRELAKLGSEDAIKATHTTG